MGLVKLPPMGWNSWNTFGSDINQDMIKEIADVMVNDGYLDAGYDTLVIDDGWQADKRSIDGHLMCDSEKFPNGLKAVVDYVHKKGLKFGIYSAAGVKTCSGRPGSFEHEFIDAKDFADIGVDYLKYDLCHFAGKAKIKSAYFTMSMALKASGRDIVFSIASTGEGNPFLWARSIGGDLFRSTPDIIDNFISIKNIALSQLDNLYMSGYGCFNDLDMLVVGMNGVGYAARSPINNGCSLDEYLVHFAIWCLFQSPLMIGCDIRHIDDDCKRILLNKNLIAINQDACLRNPYFEHDSRYSDKEKLILFKILEENKFALAFFNLTEYDAILDAYLTDYGLPVYADKSVDLVDILTGENVGTFTDVVSIKLKKHSCKIFKGSLN